MRDDELVSIPLETELISARNFVRREVNKKFPDPLLRLGQWRQPKMYGRWREYRSASVRLSPLSHAKSLIGRTGVNAAHVISKGTLPLLNVRKEFRFRGHVLLASAFQDSGERVSRGAARSCGLEMRVKVEEAMQEGVSWCGPETTIAELARIMRDDDVGVIAISQNDKLIGMVTDRDLACRALADGEDASLLMARDVMTKGVVFCRSDQDVEEAIHIMEAQRVRRLPVVNEKREMVGLLALENVCAKLPPRLSHDAIKVLSAQRA